jgi:DNA-binding Xre family transcriptional regulator
MKMRQKERDEELIFAEEEFLVDVQFAIQKLLNQSGMSHSDLAKKLGVSDARVSQMFGDEAANLTLRTVARIFCVLGDKCHITSDLLENSSLEATISDALAHRGSKLKERISADVVMKALRASRQHWRASENENFVGAALLEREAKAA